MAIYSDMKSDLNVLANGSVEIVYDEDVIIQSIRTIFSTISGERVRTPLGTTVLRLLFQPLNSTTAGQLRTELASAIVRYEPRVSVSSLTITPNYQKKTYEVTLVAQIRGISDPLAFNTSLRSQAIS